MGENHSGSWEEEVREQQGFRLQMVNDFGFTVMDQGLALTRCPHCGNLAGINSAFPDADWSSLPHLLQVLENYFEAHDEPLICASCEGEFALSKIAESAQYWVWHAHYLAEAQEDLQVLLQRKGGKTEWIEGMLIGLQKNIVPLPMPLSEQEFKDRAGCYFSVRQVWRDFLREHWPISQFCSLEVSDGYYLVLNPPVDSDSDLSDFKSRCVALVEPSSHQVKRYEFADLSWADSWKFEENTYHQWLSDYETDLEESTLIAGVLASPYRFCEVIEKEVQSFGCYIRREDEQSDSAFLGDDQYYLSFDLRQYLLNAMVKGYSYWGALRYIEPVLDSWERARDAGERLKQILSANQCSVFGGHYFQCRAKNGKKIIKEFDLLSLSEPEDDIEDQAGFLRWIAPQISLDPQTLRFRD